MDKKKVAVPLVCHGHSRPVVDLFYSPVTPDGFFLISASKDSTPMLRNGETGDWIGTFEGHKGAVWSCCLDTNALRAASASADFSAKLWDALTGDVLHSFDHKHIVRACAFSEDTHLLLTGGFEKILRVFDLNRPDAPAREVEKSPGSIRTVAWLHSDQAILSSCSDSGGVRLWDVRSGKIVNTLETKSPVTSAEVSNDGRYITTADGSSVKFWDANQYLAPEYAESGQITEKADVYSFGVVLVELVSGRKAVDLNRPKGQHCLTEWARPLLEEGAIDELVDPRLDNCYSEDEVHCMLQAASLCIKRDPHLRPKMSQVLRILEGDLVISSSHMSSPMCEVGKRSDMRWANQQQNTGSPLTKSTERFNGKLLVESSSSRPSCWEVR